MEEEQQNISHNSEDDSNDINIYNLDKICEENFLKDTFLLKSLIELKKQFSRQKKDILSYFTQFANKYNDLKGKTINDSKTMKIKENYSINPKNEKMSSSFFNNNKNAEFLSQSMAEYFPTIEKNTSIL